MRRNEWFWLAGLLTGLNLFFGFWAILQVVDGNYLTACWLIVIASICDGLDGKLARWTNSASEIGIEMDSLADVVSFGAAPGVLLYYVSFNKFGLLGVLVASLPLICGTFRLARFNLHATTGDKKGYVGLPIPMQAITIATFVVFNFAIWDSLALEMLLIPLTFFLAIMMVSHAPYDAMPRITFRDTRSNLLKLFAITGGIILVAINPPVIFFPLLMLYVLKGFVLAFIGVPEADIEAEPAPSEIDEESII